MKILLLSIPFITTLLGFIIYRYQDKRQWQIFRLDLVQFTYLFLFAPTIYVWSKSFLFYLLRNELNLSLTPTGLFVIDTVYSVLAFVVFGATAMHSLTKTFWLRRHHDPKFDIYSLSEYFHLYWTHIVMWNGIMILLTFIAFVNVFVPFAGENMQKTFWAIIVLGLASGVSTFMGIWGSDPGQGNFMRLMKLCFMMFFFIHVVMYFVFDPPFKLAHSMYWFSFFHFLGGAVGAFFFEKSEKAKQVRGLWLHVGWGENKDIQLFPFKKK